MPQHYPPPEEHARQAQVTRWVRPIAWGLIVVLVLWLGARVVELIARNPL